MKSLIAIIAVSFSLAACDSPESPEDPKSVIPVVKDSSIKRNINPEQLVRGANLFQKNCASCHGAQAQGALNWQKQGADGKFPPPPLNGTGHTWHHPQAALKYTIKKGTGAIGGNMPAFADKLNDVQIEDVLTFLQEKWPAPLYEAWYRTDERSRNAKTK